MTATPSTSRRSPGSAASIRCWTSSAAPASPCDASGFVLKDDPPEQLIAAIRDRGGRRRASLPRDHRGRRPSVRARAAPRPAPPEGLNELTAREHDVLRLIAQGLSNAEIGRELFIREGTVKTHVTHALQKLGLRDRVQAVVLPTRPACSRQAARRDG